MPIQKPLRIKLCWCYYKPGFPRGTQKDPPYWIATGTSARLLCSHLDCGMPGLPVQHQLPESAQIHVQQVGDAIQPSHPLSSPCPPAFNLSASGSFPMSQFFTSGGQSIRTSASASVLPMNVKDWFPLGLTGLISLQSKGLSRVFSNTTVQKHQFFRAQPSSQSNSHIHMTTGKTIALTR